MQARSPEGRVLFCAENQKEGGGRGARAKGCWPSGPKCGRQDACCAEIVTEGCLPGQKAGGLGLAERKRGRKGCCFLSHRSSKRCHFLHRLSLFSPKYVFSLPEYNSSPKGRRLYPQIPLHLPRGRRFLPENVTVLRNTYFSPPNVTFSTQNITTPLQKSSFSRKVENFFSPTLFPPQHDIPAKGKCSHSNARSYPKIRSSREDNIVFPDSTTFFLKTKNFLLQKETTELPESALIGRNPQSRRTARQSVRSRPRMPLAADSRAFGQFGSRQRATSAGCFPPNRGLFSAARKGAILPSPCVLAESTSPGATIQSHWRLIWREFVSLSFSIAAL